MDLLFILQKQYPQFSYYQLASVLGINENGYFIENWNLPIDQPSQSQIQSWETDQGLNFQYFQQQIEENLKILVNSKPSERQYDSVATISSYATSSNTQWKAEAEAFIAWRDSVFNTAYTTLSQIQSGSIQTPAISDFMNSLPALTWP